MLDENRDEVPDPSSVQRTVLLLDHVLDAVPRYVGKLRVEPVNYPIQGSQFFTNSHRHSVGYRRCRVKA